MITIRQLMRNTPHAQRKRLPHVVLRQLRGGYRKRSGNPIITAIGYTTHDPDGNPKPYPNRYRLLVEGLHGHGSLVSYRYVKVRCSCQAFKYFWEVALDRKGAITQKRYSNGELPLIRNPILRTGVCPHLYALLSKILDNRW